MYLSSLILIIVVYYVWMVDFKDAEKIKKGLEENPEATIKTLAIWAGSGIIALFAISYAGSLFSKPAYSSTIASSTDITVVQGNGNTLNKTIVQATTSDPCINNNSSIYLGDNNNVHFTGGGILVIGRPALCTGKNVNLSASGTPIVNLLSSY